MSVSPGHSAFVIGAASSGSGKTTLTLALLEALRRRSLVVQPFKAGPDYIDPGHHRAVLGVPSYNLDTWMMGIPGVRKTFAERSGGARVSVVEGVMGLFDGKDGVEDEGSTAHLAKVLGLPVLLVVDAGRAARSVAAVVSGFERFDPGVDVRWVVFNRVAGERHYGMLKSSVEASTGVKVLGWIPRSSALSMPSRHLGLVTHSDMKKKAWKGFLDAAASMAEEHLDIGALLEPATVRVRAKAARRAKGERKVRARVGVAADNAFCFYYRENLDMLEESGAELVHFSPLKSKRLPRGIDGLYIGGGYPELHGERLAGNIWMREDIRRASNSGMPVYAECGGLMYLGRSIYDVSGARFPMAGVFPWATKMHPKRTALGYREVRATGECPFLREGGVLRGHEYHYSDIGAAAERSKKAFSVTGGAGAKREEGYIFKNTLASYIHLHFSSNPSFVEGFLARCIEYSGSR